MGEDVWAAAPSDPAGLRAYQPSCGLHVFAQVRQRLSECVAAGLQFLVGDGGEGVEDEQCRPSGISKAGASTLSPVPPATRCLLYTSPSPRD